MTRSVRLYAIIAAVAVILASGVFVAYRLIGDRVNDVIPQTDLFGDGNTSPTGPGSSGPSASQSPPPGADIKGPLNILVIGIDSRESYPGWFPHSDAVMIMHINADLTKAYLTSLPRDLVLNVPAFPPANLSARRTRLTNAMALGSRVPGSNRPSWAQGFQLVARTVSNYTGIARFDAGALLSFRGLDGVVNAIGGIDVYIDQRIVSIHLMPNGQHKPPCSTCAHGYGGPSATYEIGMRHLVGWQALDVARQRYLPGGDYSRQRHQRAIVKAIMVKVLKMNLLASPATLDRLLGALSKTLIFDGRGRKPIEFAYALRNVQASSMALISLPGASINNGGTYGGESLLPVQATYFAALRQDKLDAFVAAHPTMVNRTSP